MDSLITAAARALAAGDPLGALKRVARARCVVAEAEIAFASRDLGWRRKALDAARETLESHRDPVNAAHARYLDIRRLLLLGRLDDAANALQQLEPAALPPKTLPSSASTSCRWTRNACSRTRSSSCRMVSSSPSCTSVVRANPGTWLNFCTRFRPRWVHTCQLD